MIEFLYSAILLLVFSFIVFRVIVRRDYLKRQKLTPISYILENIVFVVHIILWYLPMKWPNLPSLSQNYFVIALSIILFCMGLIILLIAWFGLGTCNSLGQNKDTLRTTGIYGYTRNPQLVGYGIMILSIVILYLSWYSIGWFALYLIIAYFMIKSEEEFLQKVYRDEYVEYCKKVPRILKPSC